MSQTNFKRGRIVLVIIFLYLYFLLPLSFAKAQRGDLSLTIDNVNTEAFPTIGVLTSVYDGQKVLAGLTRENFSLYENGVEVPILAAESTFEHSLEIVLLIDLSASMGYGNKPTPLMNAFEATRMLLNNLSPEDKVALIGFYERVDLLEVFTPDKSRINQKLSLINTRGQAAAVNEALVYAVNLLEDEQAVRPVVILITDSMDYRGSRVTWDDAIARAIQSNTIVHAIFWGAAKKEDMNKVFITGGVAKQLPSLPGQYPDSLSFENAMNEVITELSKSRLQYLLTYTSSLPRDGREHQLQVRVNYLGRQSETTARITVPRSELTILLDEPLDGSQVGGKVTIAPRFQGPEAVVRMDVLLNGNPLDTVSNPPFEYLWDTSPLVQGDYTLTLIAYDAAGATARKDLAVFVRPPIFLSISSPSDKSRVSGSTDITIAIDSLYSIQKVEYYLDTSENPFAIVSEPPFSTIWNLSGVTEGLHRVTVRAWDVKGNFTEVTNTYLVKASTSDGGGIWGAALAFALAAGLGVLLLVVTTRNRRMRRQGVGPIPSSTPAGAGGTESGRGILVELQGLNPGSTHKLPAEGDIRLGRRQQENDIILAGASASRNHAVIRNEGGVFVAYSLKPQNPLVVNGVETTRAVLKAGDILQLGDSVFQFQ